MNTIRQRTPAFTLLEVMIAVAIAGIVSGGLFTVFNASFRHWSRISKRAEISLYGKIAIDNVSRDIREALDIIEIGEQYFVFRARDNLVYRYILQDNTLYKSTPSENIPLVNNAGQFRVERDGRFMVIFLNLETEDTAVSYRTAAVMRIGVENE